MIANTYILIAFGIASACIGAMLLMAYASICTLWSLRAKERHHAART